MKRQLWKRISLLNHSITALNSPHQDILKLERDFKLRRDCRVRLQSYIKKGLIVWMCWHLALLNHEWILSQPYTLAREFVLVKLIGGCSLCSTITRWQLTQWAAASIWDCGCCCIFRSFWTGRQLQLQHMDWGQTSSSCSLSVLLIALRRWRVLWIRAELEGKLTVGSLTAAQLVVAMLAMPG